jgi:predicted transcriptional regulator
MDIQNFLLRLRRLIDSGVRQNDLAAMSGVPQCVISKLYSGKRTDCRTSTLFKLWPFVMGSSPASKKRDEEPTRETQV